MLGKKRVLLPLRTREDHGQGESQGQSLNRVLIAEPGASPPRRICTLWPSGTYLVVGIVGSLPGGRDPCAWLCFGGDTGPARPDADGAVLAMGCVCAVRWGSVRAGSGWE